MASHPRVTLIAWVAAIAVGAWGAHRLPQVAVGGTGGIPGSPSDTVARALRTEFTNPFIDPLVVAVSAPALRIDDAPYLNWLKSAARVLGALPSVRSVADYSRAHDPQMRSTDGHVTFMLVGLASSDNEAHQHAVAAVRSALQPLRAELLALDPGAQAAVTGGPAADFAMPTPAGPGPS